MKLFLDSANLQDIETAAALGVIRGVTTNPSLVAGEGATDFPSLIKHICAIIDGPISAEVMAVTAPEMIAEAKTLAAIDPTKIAIKIPMCAEGLKAVTALSAAGIMTNVTLIFSAPQALLAAAAGATFVSPFAGRLDDVGQDGIAVVQDIAEIFDYHGIETEIIAASIRHPMHVVSAAKAGAHCATVPYKILQQMIRHPLTDAGIKRFEEDWSRVQAAK